MTFMAVDMAGGVFCILSLVFKESIDILATVCPAFVYAWTVLIAWLDQLCSGRAVGRDRCYSGVDSESTGETEGKRAKWESGRAARYDPERGDGCRRNRKGGWASGAKGRTGVRPILDSFRSTYRKYRKQISL
jgi:hypothetical protein